MKKLLTALLFSFSTLFCFAQPTGDFTRTILTQDPQLNGDSLHIYFHIPSAFDFGQSAKIIIGLHGLGDPATSIQMRQYLSAVGDTMNSIVMCPDPYLQDQPKSRAALNQSIDSVLTWYSIDENEMYIAGYSAGSDVAAQYVFEAPEHKMKGLIWHSPGFFATPNMSNQATFPPVCLCYGTSDYVSILQANTLNSTFSSSSVPYLYNQVPGVGHTMNYPTVTAEVLECINFIDANSTSGVNENAFKSLSVFPNPVSGNDVLTVSGLAPGNQVEVFDATGHKVASYYRTNTSDKMYIQDFSLQFEKGIYLLRISGTTNTAFRKVLVR